MGFFPSYALDAAPILLVKQGFRWIKKDRYGSPKVIYESLIILVIFPVILY